MSRSKGTQRRVCCSSAVWVYSGGEGRSGVVVLVTECYGMWVYIMNEGRVSWGGGRGEVFCPCVGEGRWKGRRDGAGEGPVE